MKNNQVVLLIVSIFLLIIFGYFLFGAEEADELAYRPIDVGGGAIMVENQVDMNRVVLDVEVVEPGFVSIHESMSGAPARLIGNSGLLEPGFHEGVEIILNTPMIPGFRYITLLTVDNGNGVFELGVDLPVMVDGEVVRPDFVATPE